MNKNLKIRNSTAEFLIFTSQSGEDSLEVKVADETVWLTQKLIAELFGKARSTIAEHLQKIFLEDELDEKSVCREFRHTADDAKNYNTKFYNLDAIISVGYRVNSKKATQFRKWATSVLKEFAIKGFVLDKKRLENGSFLGEEYFAIHGHTASELIKQRANSDAENMGLTSWENAPDGKILKNDIVIAKNYLTKDELDSLGRIVNAYLDLAENRAKRNIPMTMEDWAKRVDMFLEFDDREILQDNGNISAKLAKDFALSEFEKYRVVQDKFYKSDFDKMLEELNK